MGHSVTGNASLSAMVAAVRQSGPRLGPVRLVCVDGPAGSGKSTLAGRLAQALGAPLVHLDDLYGGWSGLDDADFWPRVERQLLGPLESGRPARWQRYDWVAADWAEWHDVPVPEVFVLEGCGCAPRAVDGRTSLLIWVHAPADVRLERGLVRDGESMRDDWLRWMGQEAVHFAREGTRERADVLIDGTREVPA